MIAGPLLVPSSRRLTEITDLRLMELQFANATLIFHTTNFDLKVDIIPKPGTRWFLGRGLSSVVNHILSIRHSPDFFLTPILYTFSVSNY